MKFLGLHKVNENVDVITRDSPDGRYVDLVTCAIVYKRERYLYRDYGHGRVDTFRDYAWDLEYHNPQHRDYPYPSRYEGEETEEMWGTANS